MKKKLILALILSVFFGGFFVWQNQKSTVLTVDLPVAQNYQDFVTSTKEEIKDETEPNKEQAEENVTAEKEIKNINLNISFTSQAPLGDWSQPWQDACEEASVLMVDYYYQNKNFPSKEVVADLLKEMVSWQESNWGGHYNLTIARLAEYIKATFNYDTEIIENLTNEKLKFYLDKGQPVIVPANGKKLANPNFKNGGPEYHMLVVKGYVDDKFITNDPGTRLGANFIYTSENLLDSIADWNALTKKADGPKIGIIIF